MNEKELQKEFIQFLAKQTGAKSQKELEEVVKKLGEEGMKKAYEAFLQEKQKAVKAANGAKLQYINFLNGKCPDGSMPTFHKQGGKMIKKCGCGGDMVQHRRMNPVLEFKASRRR